MKSFLNLVTSISLATFIAIIPARLNAETTLLGYNTNGDVYQINPTTGSLTQKASEQIHSFSLGAIVRRKDTLYYIAAPAGTTENSLFIANTKTGSISHVDLDRSDADDDVAMLFIEGKKLYGLFSNTSSGTLGLYLINTTTGATTLKLNFSTLNLEPIPGAISRIGAFVYFIAKPSSDSSRRQLVRFRVKSPIVKVVEIEGTDKNSVLCDRLKLIRRSLKFLCLASTTTTTVDSYRLNQSGKAIFLGNIGGIERLAGGHTMVTPNEKEFSFFAYATGESNSQRLITLSATGQVKSNAPISTIIVGARYGIEEPETE